MNTKIIALFMLLTLFSVSAAEAFPFFGHNRGYGCHRHHHHRHHHRGW